MIEVQERGIYLEVRPGRGRAYIKKLAVVLSMM
jgi:hypothetical protein